MSTVTKQDIVDEVQFIRARTQWLMCQLRNINGMLMSQDLCEECGMLRRRIEELERLYHVAP